MFYLKKNKQKTKKNKKTNIKIQFQKNVNYDLVKLRKALN